MVYIMQLCLQEKIMQLMYSIAIMIQYWIRPTIIQPTCNYDVSGEYEFYFIRYVCSCRPMSVAYIYAS